MYQIRYTHKRGQAPYTVVKDTGAKAIEFVRMMTKVRGVTSIEVKGPNWNAVGTPEFVLSAAGEKVDDAD